VQKEACGETLSLDEPRRAARPGAESGDVAAASLRAAAGEGSSWEPLDEVAPSADLTLRADRPVEDLAADMLGLLDQRIGRLRG
jgi:hypothetical protein